MRSLGPLPTEKAQSPCPVQKTQPPKGLGKGNAKLLLYAINNDGCIVVSLGHDLGNTLAGGTIGHDAIREGSSLTFAAQIDPLGSSACEHEGATDHLGVTPEVDTVVAAGTVGHEGAVLHGQLGEGSAQDRKSVV